MRHGDVLIELLGAALVAFGCYLYRGWPLVIIWTGLFLIYTARSM